jgi:aryl-alcohol dehydrogenase-like predicted oxidoreductase
VHEWDGQTPLEEMLEAMAQLLQQGKIRYAGCSNFSGWHLMKALHISHEKNLPRFVTQQIHYTLEAREAEYELLPIAVDQGVGVMVWSPLAGGLLSGKYTRKSRPEGVTRMSEGWTEPPIRDEERLWNIVDVLHQIAGEHEASPAQVALAWTLSRPGVVSLVIGGRKIEQIRENLDAAELHLTEEDLSRLNSVSEPPLIYPYWHQDKFARGTFSAGDWALFGGR